MLPAPADLTGVHCARERSMFFLNYMFSELRRRRGRTILTALGLAVGVGLVVMVNALSTGLDNAQASVLKPLTGVGTDMSVTRPLKVTSNGSGGFGALSPAQQKQLRKEVGGGPGVAFASLKAGSKIDTDTFRASGDLTFSSSELQSISNVKGVAAVAGSLTLTDTHLSGTVPKVKITQSQTGGGGRQGRGAPSFGPASGALSGGSIKTSSLTVTGVDQTKSSLGAVTPSQITKGKYFSQGGNAYEAIVSTGYANSNSLSVGSKVTIGGKTFDVIGISSAPLGGSASDVYVKLATLQKLAGYTDQIDTAEVQAANASDVTAVSNAIGKQFKRSQVTTASDLASRVSGSLTDAKNLASKLGAALEVIALIAAVLIASLLTLSSVAKRVREIGTLKAVGWSRLQVVRQICGEALGQGVLGGLVGIVVGIAGVAVINALGWTLKATVASPAGAGGGGPGFGFGQAASSAITAGSTAVKVTAVASGGLILVAVCLAVLGGLASGAIGGLRAARLRPAAALRTVE
jgi:ABC-type antimicrobial peptide transport system permease subunit